MTYTREDFLRQYHALDDWQEEVRDLYDKVETGEATYYQADEARADLYERLAELADMAAAIFEEEK